MKILRKYTVPALPHLCISVLVYLLATTSASSEQTSITGSAYAVDGDTLVVDSHTIHLDGIDAIELDQECIRDAISWPCGQRAREILEAFVNQRNIKCVIAERTSEDQWSGRCHTLGLDVAAEVMTQGYAVIFPKTATRYRRLLYEARGRGNGIYSGRFEQPEAWRARHENKAVD